MTLDELRDAILAVVDYNWQAESADYHAQTAEDRQGHIFETLVALGRFAREGAR